MKRKLNPELEILLEILYAALDEPIGLLLSTPQGMERVRNGFYLARDLSQDPALSELQLRSSPFPDGDLVIVKQRIKLG